MSLMIRVKRAELVLVSLERVTSLGGVPVGEVHCQRKLPSPPTTEQERVRFGEMSSTPRTTGDGGRTENGGSCVVGGRVMILVVMSGVTMVLVGGTVEG